MKITVEITIDDAVIEHQSIAEKQANRVIQRLDQMFEFEFRTETSIEVNWEFQKFSGSMTNERNPS
jgi:hypothetical protein